MGEILYRIYQFIGDPVSIFIDWPHHHITTEIFNKFFNDKIVITLNERRDDKSLAIHLSIQVSIPKNSPCQSYIYEGLRLNSFLGVYLSDWYLNSFVNIVIDVIIAKISEMRYLRTIFTV